MAGALFAIVIVLYLLPTCIAVFEKKEHALPIAIINVFLGWTVLGWIGALIWAIMAKKKEVEKKKHR